MRAHLAAAILLASIGGVARADDEAAGRSVEGELGLAVVYSNTDLVSLGGFFGFSFGKPILNVFYVEPVLHGEMSLMGGARFAGLLRCNFMAAPGAVLSLGFGAGTGYKTVTDDNFNSMQLARDFREVELAVKMGGKRRFFVGVALAFDRNEMGEESKAVMLQTTLIRAYP